MSTKTEEEGDVHLLTVDEVAARLRLSTAQVRKMMNKGELPVVDVRLAGSTRQHRRVRSDHVTAYIEQRTVNK